MAGSSFSTALRRLRRTTPVLPILIVALGLAATLSGALMVDRVGDVRDRQRFDSLADQANDALGGQLQTYVAILHAGAGLFAASQTVTRDEFRAFAERVDLGGRYGGIQGLGYSAQITPERGGAEARHAVLFLEPEDARNRMAIGLDMYAEPVRREAMSRARDTGLAAMSGKVELVQEIDEHRQAGFLIYEPVYAGGAPPATLEARRSALAGFLYAPFRAGDLLQAVFDGIDQREFDYAVYNGEIAPDNLLAASAPASALDAGQASGLFAVRQVSVAGGTWTIVYRAGPGFGFSAAHELAWIFACGGLLATGLVAVATWRQGKARMAAERELAARIAIEARQKLLLDELNHRVKNTLATVQSIAAQSLRQTGDVESVRRNFEDRLIALSHAHNLLTRDAWRGANLAELAEIELRPYAGPDGARIEIIGPAVWLSPNTAVAMSMALHELTTNAVKYGALSNPTGHVALEWTLSEATAEQERLTLIWEEQGGPPVTPPKRRGFGSRLIVGGLAHQLDGEVDLTFPAQGVRCVITFLTPRQVAAEMMAVGKVA
ncbi:MAG: CHASE domain-containing protein [Phenylobacterium sp.]|uniref:CHASE domain-containing protein n=1 Tax=Phenylobacterium sp. TaxID=1871053 RepID=UPI002726054F|nr:CHASE domain-containing protein [Phenylobacterium sp.]MDO8411540.1 CHASE domain-containing protein [Phenylobacterium sp.]